MTDGDRRQQGEQPAEDQRQVVDLLQPVDLGGPDRRAAPRGRELPEPSAGPREAVGIDAGREPGDDRHVGRVLSCPRGVRTGRPSTAAPSASGSGSSVARLANTTWPTTRNRWVATGPRTRTVSPTCLPIASSVAEPRTISPARRGARPVTIVGSIDPLIGSNPHMVTGWPSTSTLSRQMASIAPRLRSCGGLRIDVAAHRGRLRGRRLAHLEHGVPGRAVQGRGRHEVVEAPAEHEHGDDAQRAERGAEERRADRHGVRAAAGLERHPQPGRQPRVRARTFGDAGPRPTDGPMQRRPVARRRLRRRATRSRLRRRGPNTTMREEAEPEHERVDVDAEIHLGLAARSRTATTARAAAAVVTASAAPTTAAGTASRATADARCAIAQPERGERLLVPLFARELADRDDRDRGRRPRARRLPRRSTARP